MNSRLYLFRALTVGWMMLIFFLSSQPSLPVVSLFSGMELLAHAACYAVLGLFLAQSLVPPHVTTWKRVLLLTILVTVYGVTDEYHQSFVPGRDASAWDILADGLGGFRRPRCFSCGIAGWLKFHNTLRSSAKAPMESVDGNHVGMNQNRLLDYLGHMLEAAQLAHS